MKNSLDSISISRLDIKDTFSIFNILNLLILISINKILLT